MKRKIASILTLSILVFAACKSQKSAADSTGKGTAAVMTSTKADAPQVKSNTSKVAKKEIEQISMNRSACMGTCPVYKVEVNKSGKVTYYGMSFVDYKGTYEKTFTKEQVAELFGMFLKHRVDTCSEDYESMIADVPGVYYKITYTNNREQKINNAHFGPEYLNTLSFEVDSFAKVDDSWKKVADSEDN